MTKYKEADYEIQIEVPSNLGDEADELLINQSNLIVYAEPGGPGEVADESMLREPFSWQGHTTDLEDHARTKMDLSIVQTTDNWRGALGSYFLFTIQSCPIPIMPHPHDLAESIGIRFFSLQFFHCLKLSQPLRLNPLRECNFAIYILCEIAIV